MHAQIYIVSIPLDPLASPRSVKHTNTLNPIYSYNKKASACVIEVNQMFSLPLACVCYSR